MTFELMITFQKQTNLWSAPSSGVIFRGRSEASRAQHLSVFSMCMTDFNTKVKEKKNSSAEIWASYLLWP